jgi:hypothetical protein
MQVLAATFETIDLLEVIIVFGIPLAILAFVLLPMIRRQPAPKEIRAGSTGRLDTPTGTTERLVAEARDAGRDTGS